MGDSVSHEQLPASPDLGGVKWEMRFYEDILKRKPDYVEVLTLLADLYTGRKMYAQGLKIDQRLAALKKDDPIVHYNLACSYALLGQLDEAFRALTAAVELGYRDLAHMEKDTDLAKIRSDHRYGDLAARIQHAAHG